MIVYTILTKSQHVHKIEQIPANIIKHIIHILLKYTIRESKFTKALHWKYCQHYIITHRANRDSNLVPHDWEERVLPFHPRVTKYNTLASQS